MAEIREDIADQDLPQGKELISTIDHNPQRRKIKGILKLQKPESIGMEKLTAICKHLADLGKVTELCTEAMDQRDDFDRWRPDRETHENIARAFNVSADTFEIELVKVKRDLSQFIHFHAKTDNATIVLGQKHGLETDPTNDAKAYLGNKWHSISIGSSLEIPAGTHHVFTTTSGQLYFLSVQSPPIQTAYGTEADIHFVGQ